MASQVVLGLGGNIGNVEETLQKSLYELKNRIGPIQKESSLYKTKAWGVENQPNFINQVVELESELHPEQVLQVCLEIEKELGRERTEGNRWGERVIDIDVLFYNQAIIKKSNLIIPHPHIQNRNFVLYPLAEILPEFLHPILKKNIAQLKDSSKDELEVEKK